MQFQTGEFFGFHTKGPQKTGLSFCLGGSQLPACNCGFSSFYYSTNIRDASLPIGATITWAKLKNKMVAIMANIEP